ncbi:MAG: tetratricopeptide repeat protein [Bacteroidota bacterium]
MKDCFEIDLNEHIISGLWRKLLVLMSVFLGGAVVTFTYAQAPATDSLKRVLSVAQHDTIRTKILLNLVWEYTFTQPDTALLYGEKALTMSQDLGDTTYLIEALKAMGTIYSVQADYATALDYLFESLALSRAAGDQRNSFSVLMNIGNAMKGQGETTQSKSYYEEALAIGEQLQDTSRLVVASINLGAILYDQREYQQSLKYNRRAVTWIEQHGVQQRLLGHALVNIGSALAQLGKSSEALTYLKRGLAVVQTTGDGLTETVILHNIAETHLDLNQLDEALDYSRQALERAQTATFTKEESDAFLLLSEILEAQGDYGQALQYHKQHLTLQDSIFNQTSSQQIAELQTQYETEQKEQQITVLTQERSLQNIREKQMSQQRLGLLLGAVLLLTLLGVTFNRYRLKQRALSTIRVQKQAIEAKSVENELLIREIHHRVKNNLQIIMSLLNTQANVLSDSQAVEVIAESQNRVKSMALIHEKLYQSSNFTQVPTQPYLSEMAQNVAQFYQKRVQLHLDIEPNEISMSTAVPLGLIVNELLTNAFKHAFKGVANAHLWVTFRTEGMNGSRRHHLQIKDNGTGLPRDFEPEQSRSFGLRLIKGLTHQLNGEFEIRATSGACFTIRFREVVSTE